MPNVYINISIHASHAGCDAYIQTVRRTNLQFQSTHPMQDATYHCFFVFHFLIISIHASHAGCDLLFGHVFKILRISIHASHAGCDRQVRRLLQHSQEFQSTHPMRDATSFKSSRLLFTFNFNPRIPCGMRLYRFVLMVLYGTFQSTHPMRDATTSIK